MKNILISAMGGLLILVMLASAAWADGGQAAKGKTLYQQNKCALCHGANGEGKGNFPKLAGKFQNTPTAEIIGKIKNAKPPMPKVKLSDGDLENLAKYLKTL